MLSGRGVSPPLHCGGISIGSWQWVRQWEQKFLLEMHFFMALFVSCSVNGAMPRSRSEVSSTRYGRIIIWHLIKWDKSSGVFWIIISYQLRAVERRDFYHFPRTLEFRPRLTVAALMSSSGAVACRHKNANILVMYSLLTKWLEPFNSFQVTSDIIELQLMLKNNQIQNDISQLFTTSQQPVMAISVLIDNQ